jgi:hypothetical protein
LYRRRDYYHNPRNPDASPFIFITYYNESDYVDLRELYSPFPWAHPYQIPKTWLQDIFFITHHLQDILYLSTTNTHWIGSIPWIKHPSYSHLQNMMHRMIQDVDLVQDGVDVLAFYTTGEEGTVSHPLMDELQYILISMGEAPEKLAEYQPLLQPDGSRFYYLATLDLMQQFIPWISRAVILMQADPVLREIQSLWQSDMFDLFFRNGLVSYFFMTRGRKIVFMMEYEDIVNERERIKLENERFDMENSRMVDSLSS